MSAWIVSKTHIDRMVNTAVDWEFVTPTNATALGRLLWTENLKSVAARYPDDGSGERPGPIGLTDSAIRQYVADEAASLTPTELLKAIRCLNYQSCEHDGWANSGARLALNELEAAAKLRGGRDSGPDYDAAPWGFD